MKKPKLKFELTSEERNYQFRYSDYIVYLRFNYADKTRPFISIKSSEYNNARLAAFKGSLLSKFGHGFIQQDLYDYLRNMSSNGFKGNDYSELQRILKEGKRNSNGISLEVFSLEDKV